jgi:nucleotide-binding universal stress UspA family protein
VWPDGSPAHHARDRDEARAVLEAAREEAGIDGDLWCVESSSVGAGLHELAEDEGADLLVVGSSRRGLLGRVMLGDDTRAALNGAPCAVAPAPAGYAQQPRAIERVGVGYNCSPESEHALGVGRKLARQFSASLAAFEAVSIPALVVMGGAAPVGMSFDELVSEPGTACRPSAASRAMLPTEWPPRSCPASAPRLTCSSLAPAATARLGGSCTAAPPGR